MTTRDQRRKAVIVECTAEVAGRMLIGEPPLPQGVRVTATNSEIGSTSTLVRLEGNGLPEWARVDEGMRLQLAIVRWQEDGTCLIDIA